MDNKNKIFFAAFFALIFAVVITAYFKYFVWRDYYITAEADCDPETEKCFIYECDPNEDSECPEDPGERVSYYKLIKKKAYLIPDCDLASEECGVLVCEPGENCEEILCNEKTAGKEEQCNDPEEYLKENPPEDDESVFDEEDGAEECDSDLEECSSDVNKDSAENENFEEDGSNASESVS